MGDIHVTGHCYCGGVTYAVDLPEADAPIFQIYCHCDSCRRAHAAPLYQVVCIDAAHFRITSGDELVVPFQKPGATVTRAFCGACGSRIYNRFGTWRPQGREPLVFFPATLDEDVQHDLPEVFLPTRHAHADECVLEASVLSPLLEAR